MMKKHILLLTALLTAAMLLTACATPSEPEATAAPAASTQTEQAEATEAAEATDSAEDSASAASGISFSLDTLTGGTIDQTIITNNKLTMVNYWATWCGPCVSEIPDLVEISEAYADQGFALIGVLTGDTDVDGAKEFIAEKNVSYPIVMPEGFFADMAGDIYAIPTTMFFDSEGNQVGDTIVGAKSYDDWSGLIDLLLSQVS